MSRKAWLLAIPLVAGVAALSAVMLVNAEESNPTRTVIFGFAGDPADPPMGGGGTTRDRNDPTSLVVKKGTTVEFLNRSGGMHQVALYDKGLNFNDPGCVAAGNCANLTTMADVIVLPGVQSWGNFITPPDGSIPADDPATPVVESTANAGVLRLGPSPVGVPGPARQSGAIDFSYTFQDPGQYMVICNFKPHFVDYAQVTFVLVTPD